MQKKQNRTAVILIHGYRATPRLHWFPWAIREFKKRGYDVSAPQMPNPSKPSAKSWVKKIESVVKGKVGPVVFIGHSLGGTAILKYLESKNPKDGKLVDKIILVASPLPPRNARRNSITGFYEHALNYKRIKQNVEKIIGIYSKDDPVVLLENAAALKKKYGAQIYLFADKGHFTSEKGVNSLDVLLEII